MINIPFEHIIEKIRQEKGLSKEEIMERIKAKMDKLSGLISKEGAAYIIANELGVKLVQPEEALKIKNIVSGMRSVEFTGKVMRMFDVVNFDKDGRKGKVMSFFVADETGQIRVTAWHDMVDKLSGLKEGDIVKITGGYVRSNNSQNEVHLNDRSKVVINPEGVEIDAKEQNLRQRRLIAMLEDNDQNVEVFATIVEVYDIRFFTVCPECGKRTVQKDDGLYCDVHGKTSLYYSYVMNLVLDDGTGHIRAVFFKNQVQRLLNKTNEEILVYVNEPEKFNDIKTELLGEQIKVIGRVVSNERFERKELVAQLVFRDINVEEEMANLEKMKKELEEKGLLKQDGVESENQLKVNNDEGLVGTETNQGQSAEETIINESRENENVKQNNLNEDVPVDDILGDNVVEEKITMDVDDDKKDKKDKEDDVLGIDDI